MNLDLFVSKVGNSIEFRHAKGVKTLELRVMN
jgi:hypothetical protein